MANTVIEKWRKPGGKQTVKLEYSTKGGMHFVRLVQGAKGDVAEFKSIDKARSKWRACRAAIQARGYTEKISEK